MEQLRKKPKANFSSHSWPGPVRSHSPSVEPEGKGLHVAVGGAPRRGLRGVGPVPGPSAGPPPPLRRRAGCTYSVTRPGSSTTSGALKTLIKLESTHSLK